MTANFSSPDEVVINRKLTISSQPRVSNEFLENNYQIPECIEWIKENNFKQVALQIPDELMKDSISIADKIQSKIDGKVFILGDTSYGSCCVDEVAAQHYNADSIIHYGHACLSPTRRLPVKFVFGRAVLDCTDLVTKVSQAITDRDQLIILLYDTCYSHAAEELGKRMEQQYSSFIVSKLNIPNCNGISETNNEEYSCSENKEQTICRCNRTIVLPQGTLLANSIILYIGQESLTLTNIMMTFNKCSFYTYDPLTLELRKESLNVNRMLMKRYFLIEKAKDASIVGIVVGTLGVEKYLEVINRLKTLIKKAGKKSYTFVVGKLNVPKLANFLEVDVFVLVACPENTLLDSSEFYKPVVSVYEMEMACNRDRQWSGDYHTDFRDILPGGTDYIPIPDTEASDVTDVSLITGKLRIMGNEAVPESSSTALVTRNEAMAVTTVKAENAEEFLASRSWKGLEQKLGETQVSEVVEGKKGIASGYNHEEG